MPESKQKKIFILKKFYPYMGKKKKLIPLALFFSGSAALFNTIPFVLMWIIIREIMISSETVTFTQVLPYIWGIGGSVILGVLFYFLALTCSHLAAFRVEVGLQKIGLQKIIGMPLGFFSSTSTGKMRRVINDGATTTHVFLAHQLPDLAASWIAPIVLLIMILAVNWRLGILSLVPIFLGFFITSTMTSAKGKEFMQRYYNSLEDMSNEAVEYVRGIPVVKTFGQSIFSFKKFYNSIVTYKKYVVDYTLLWKGKMSFFNVILQTTAIFLIPATILLLKNDADPALIITDFIFYLIVAPNFMTILMRSAYFRQNVEVAEQALDRVETLLDYPYITEPDKPHMVSGNELEFRNVSFCYEGAETNAVDGISFIVRPGETVALVGASGGGKTTIAHLAARFYDVDEGEVLISGVNVKDIAVSDLMRKVSFVFQNTRLLSRSIRDNLCIGKKDATEEEIFRALELSCSSEIVEQLVDGLDTVIGTKGTYLSGGEQQRISLARAILKNSPVVLLDEATAFTDPENEELIQKALQELGRGKTTLMIAHRLSSVQNVDRILVISKGKIVEEGNHTELMEQSALYYQMFMEYEKSVDWKLQNKDDKGVVE